MNKIISLLACLFGLTHVSKAATVDAFFASPSTVPVTAASYTATGNDIDITLGFAPIPGTNLTVVKNTGFSFISGQFSNLAHGQAVNLSYGGKSYRFVANYYGGTGKDLVLQWPYQDLAAWGRYYEGQLGNNNTTDSKVPALVDQSGVLAGKTIISVAAGEYHNLALCSDGTLAASGRNYHGQLGNNSTTDSSVPVLVDQSGVLAGKTVISVAARDNHNVVLCSDGTLAAWGEGIYGQLGNGSETSSSIPVLVTQSGALAGKTAISVTAGNHSCLALCSDATLVAWGYTGTNSSSVPVLVSQSGALTGKTVVSVAAGNDYILALCADGTLAAWGGNDYGQLGNNGTTASSVPVLVDQSGVLAGKTVISVAATNFTSYALCSDGTLAAWGYNFTGVLGNNSTSNSKVPVMVDQSGVLAGKNVISVAPGELHNLALCSDGTLAAWGYNPYGELGNNSTTHSKVPVMVDQSGVLSGKTVVSMAVGDYHSLALVSRPASAVCTLARLGLNGGALSGPEGLFYWASVPASVSSVTLTPTVTDYRSSVRVNGVQVISGSASQDIHLAEGTNSIPIEVTAEDGTVAIYTVVVNRPESIDFVYSSSEDIPVNTPAFDATGLSANLSLGFAPLPGTSLTVVKNTGFSFISGRFSNLAHGQAANLSYGGKSYRFVANYYGGTGKDLVLQWAYQDLATWGYNNYGQLGNKGTTNSNMPIMVSRSGVLAGKTVISVAAGEYHNLALCSDGTLAAWGLNNYGQLGNNSTTDSSVPVLVDQSGVLAGKTIIAVAAGYYHTLALCADGTLAAWGANWNGSLGNNSTTNSSVPVLVDQSGVLAGRTVISVDAAYGYSLALCSDGTLAAWGSSHYGLLGNNSTTDSRVPVLVDQNGVLAGKTVISVAAGFSHILALCSDGTLAAWGRNSYGQLGNNSTADSSVPVLVDQSGVLTGKTVVAVAAGSYHNLALCSDGTLVAWGWNITGQLGNNSTISSSVPVLVDQNGFLAGKTVISVATGAIHSLAMCSDGTLAAWGSNDYGMLGNDPINSNVPGQVTQSGVLASLSVISAAAGGYHSLVVASVENSSDLSGLLLSSGNLNPVFASISTNYSVLVVSDFITVIPTVADATATVKVNGIPVSSGTNSPPIPLTLGDNTISVIVTAWDGVTESSYTIIAEKVSGYDFWKRGHFTLEEQNDPSTSGETANPAEDGITNLIKYALYLDPNISGRANLPTVAFHDGYLTLTYRKNKMASDLTYTVQAGAELSATEWSEASTVVSQTDEGDYWLVTVRDNVMRAGHPSRFMRLKVEMPPVVIDTGNLQILEALYGAQGGFADVRSIVESRIQNDTVNMRVGNAAFGDPSYGNYKSLYIRYQNASGQYEANIGENLMLIIPDPSHTKIQ